MYTFKDFLGGKKLEEIAATGEGRYASARDINAKRAKNVKCTGCGAPMNKDNSYSVGGKMICSTCKGGVNEDATMGTTGGNTAQQTQMANLDKQINDMNGRLQRLLQQKSQLQRQMQQAAQSSQNTQTQQTQTNQAQVGQAPNVGGPGAAPSVQ
jgi:TolA-binding protein